MEVFFSISTSVKIKYMMKWNDEITVVTRYRKVLRIAAHVENDTVWIQFQDAGHRVWKVTFRREADGRL